MRRLLGIGFVWFCCAAAWAILGATLALRTQGSQSDLGGDVRALWGPELDQAPPFATFTETHLERRTGRRTDSSGNAVTDTSDAEVTVTHPLPLVRSDLTATLAMEQRRKGLLWFPTYGVTFEGGYAFRNDTGQERVVDILFPVEKGVTYDGFEVRGADGKPWEVTFVEEGARLRRPVGAGAVEEFEVTYRARGTSRWSYGKPGEGLGPEPGRARGFSLTVNADFADVDFPAGTLSPTTHRDAGRGYSGSWRFDQIVSTAIVGIELPQRLNPGPLASKITFFAPVSLLFFFFFLGMVLAARRRSIHPVNYFLLGCAFFAFHLLFAYLIDHLEVASSFAIASVASVVLVASYARLFVGLRLALTTFALPQLVYLVLFSFTFFFEGYTGLSIAVGAVVTLFVVMQLTGRLDWGEVLSRPSAAAATSSTRI
ncbi:MAG TPA: inner membrane CreD family protein [Anaeromyxobacter sp.]|nr:inner membrane CreD family protein [Anaeromyxobacter sp.]